MQHLWSVLCIMVYIASQLFFTYVPAKLCLKWDLPFVSAGAMLMETVRMLMKMHSYVRTLSPRILSSNEKSKDKKGAAAVMPPFQKYLYFIFAPTLLYRDNYPRTTSAIRWKLVFARFMDIVAIAFLFAYIYERHIKFNFGNFGIEEINAASITAKLFGMFMPCTIIYLGTFYLILHSCQNIVAEILQFGDRMFYRDWWTAKNYDTYYRNWNIIVHDWLHEYVYKDFYNYIFKGSKLASSLMVFFISALFHEYMIGFALQVRFPVMFAFFETFGVSMIFVTRRLSKDVGNTAVWWSLIFGNCWMICLYSMEYFASKNCPKESYDSWRNLLVPHLWSCYNK